MRVREVNLPSAGGIGPVESRASTARSITSYGTQFCTLLFADDGFGGPSVRVISCFPYPDNDNDTGMIKHYITQSRSAMDNSLDTIIGSIREKNRRSTFETDSERRH